MGESPRGGNLKVGRKKKNKGKREKVISKNSQRPWGKMESG